MLANCVAFSKDKAKATLETARAPVFRVGSLGEGPSACFGNGNDTLTRLMNDDSFRTAIHVKSVSEIGKWAICTNNPNWMYTSTEKNEPRDVYPQIIQAGVRVLI